MRNYVLAAVLAVAGFATPAYAAMSKDAAVAECRAMYGPAMKRGDANANAQFSACVKAKMKGK